MLEMDENSITVKCYASDQSMLRAGLTKEDRIKKIEVIY
jgi:tRNA threonylcarbamoyladenosine modification (KEOPS) complex  Pcc1 subunit